MADDGDARVAEVYADSDSGEDFYGFGRSDQASSSSSSENESDSVAVSEPESESESDGVVASGVFITVNGVYKIPAGNCVFRLKYSGRSLSSLKKWPGLKGLKELPH